jgi:hypothetical protein
LNWFQKWRIQIIILKWNDWFHQSYNVFRKTSMFASLFEQSHVCIFKLSCKQFYRNGIFIYLKVGVF